jgi:hypothetical protein
MHRGGSGHRAAIDAFVPQPKTERAHRENSPVNFSCYLWIARNSCGQAAVNLWTDV